MRSALLMPGRRRLVLAVAVFGALTAATSLVAYPSMFAGLRPYDDEGGLLLLLRSFLDGRSLYDDVFAQYGPFYFELWGGVFWLFDVAVTHDNGRIATLVAWISASLIVGISTYRVTRSIVLGAVVQVLVFAALYSLVNEPMHPGGLICLLLASVVAISTFVQLRRAAPAMALLGAAVGALLLIKVNVGAFALASVLLVCAASYPALAARRWMRFVIEAGFLITPAVLMAGKLGAPWAQRYCAHVTLAAAAVVLLLRSRAPDPRRQGRELRAGLTGLLASTTLIGAIALIGGVSPEGLYEGVIGQPLRLGDAFLLPLELSDETLALDLVAVAGALACWHLARSRRPRRGTGLGVLLSLSSIAIGVGLGLSVIDWTFPLDPPGWSGSGSALALLGFAWVALIPIEGVAMNGRMELARRLLPALAVLQALHAFPVAGSQIGWSAFLLVPVGAICVANGVRGLAFALEGRAEGRALALVGAAVAVALALFVAEVGLRRPLEEGREAFDAATPLDLPGAAVVRAPLAEASVYRRVSTALERRCDTYLSLPGLNSFYPWSHLRPPTNLNATHWMTLYSPAQQRQVISAAKSVRRLCLLERPDMTEFWMQGRNPRGPLVRYMRVAFEPVLSIGPYRLLRRAAVEGAG